MRSNFTIISFLVFMNFYNLFSQSNENKTSIPHYFIYLKDDKQPFKQEIGNYKITKSKIKYQDSYASIDELKNELFKSGKTNQKWLVYIHGLWANNRGFEESTGKILQDNIFNNLEGYDAIISLKWTSAIDYDKNLSITEEKGKEFSKLLDKLSNEDNIELNFLLHSMGNRVFKAFYNNLDNKNYTINNVLMIAADIENDVLVNDLKKLTPNCSKIYAFYNDDDRTLSVANKLKGYKRLGIYGPCDESKTLANLIAINTTGLTDNQGIPAKFTLHRYYYASPSIRNLILDILTGKQESKLFEKVIKL